MTNRELAKEIAKGLVETGVEGAYDAVSCSTAGDYPSLGCSQWEGGRADILLSYIDGGDKFAGRTFSDIEAAGELEELAELLGSEQGIEAQLMILANDTLDYVDACLDAGLTDSRAIIYAGMWGPTSTHCVYSFIKMRIAAGHDMNDLDTCADEFHDLYYSWADCDEYKHGYQNRSNRQYEYVRTLDLSEYGVPGYDEGE
ncbi:MAG: hypothetical protein K6F62_01585 [Schwartzia sp.]|nr:hypothetical protein [Schwartzia sp. (in: firmicutes)]